MPSTNGSPVLSQLSLLWENVLSGGCSGRGAEQTMSLSPLPLINRFQQWHLETRGAPCGEGRVTSGRQGTFTARQEQLRGRVLQGALLHLMLSLGALAPNCKAGSCLCFCFQPEGFSWQAGGLAQLGMGRCCAADAGDIGVLTGTEGRM